MIKSEWRSLFHNKGLIVVLIAIALIPAIYCFLYLSSMWNTYGKMDDIPVAIVNRDENVTYKGKRIHIGKKLVKGLKKSDSLDYSLVSSKKAESGIKSGKYYMVVTIPNNFSKNATTLLTSSPKQLHLYYRINSGRNFIISKMTTGAASAIKQKVSKQVTHMYSEILLSTFTKVQKGMLSAANGSKQLADGSKTLANGATTIEAGTTSLYNGTVQLQNGTTKLLGGSTQSASGFNKLTNNSNTLNSGAAELKNGLSTMSKEVPTLKSGADKLSALATEIQQQAKNGSQGTELNAEIQALSSGLNQLDIKLPSLTNGISSLSSGSSSLDSGVTTYTSGEKKLANANTQISNGLNQLSQNIPSLVSGAKALSTGSSKIDSGAIALESGNTTLANNLQSSSNKLEQIKDTKNTANYLASPVVSTTTDEAKVPNNGTGMAPFSIAIGLFVGGIALGTMFDAYSPKSKPKNALSWWASKFSIIGVIGILQSIVLFFTLNAGNHLLPVSQVKLFIAILLGSITFLSIIFCLRIILGGFGTWLITIILVLQLSASSGLYPVELTSNFARIISPYLPMTYLIDGLRHAISLGGSIVNDSVMMIAIIVIMNLFIIYKYRHDIKKNIFALIEFS